MDQIENPDEKFELEQAYMQRKDSLRKHFSDPLPPESMVDDGYPDPPGVDLT